MQIKTYIEEDFNNYKTPSMLIGFPSCTFKCDSECGRQVCQNCELAQSPNQEVDIAQLVKTYEDNKITNAIVFGGLEPFDSWDDMFDLVVAFRNVTVDPIVIYTGYTPNEIASQINVLKAFRNIIVKFGRFIPNDESHFDEVLGVTLASHNQYAIKIS